MSAKQCPMCKRKSIGNYVACMGANCGYSARDPVERQEDSPTTPAADASSQVDHPPHYGGEANPYEAIKVIEAWLTPEQFYGFCIGNSLKYHARAGKKDGESSAKDLAKADWYTRRAVEFKSKLEASATPDK